METQRKKFDLIDQVDELFMNINHDELKRLQESHKINNNFEELKCKKIYVNKKDKVMAVKWNDGTTTKVTCGAGDVFNIFEGYCIAFTKKMYGGYTNLSRFIKNRVKDVTPQQVVFDNTKKINYDE